MSMIEQMAAEMNAAYISSGRNVAPWGKLSERGKEQYRVMAKAALSALSNPTDGMVEAAKRAGFGEKHQDADARVKAILIAGVKAAEEGA